MYENSNFICDGGIYHLQSGIYIIKNLDFKKVYVGRSDNMPDRFKKHRVSLYANEHPNRLLQADFNKGYKLMFVCLHDFKSDPTDIDKRIIELLYMYHFINKGFEIYNFNDKKGKTKQEQKNYIANQVTNKFVYYGGVASRIYRHYNDDTII